MTHKISQLDKIKALLVIVTGLVILFFIFKGKGFLIAAASVGVLSLMIPIIGDGILWVWFKLAEVLGWINSRILLSLIFFVFLFPMAFLVRLFKKNFFNLEKTSEPSIYTRRDHKYTKEDLENIW